MKKRPTKKHLDHLLKGVYESRDRVSKMSPEARFGLQVRARSIIEASQQPPPFPVWKKWTDSADKLARSAEALDVAMWSEKTPMSRGVWEMLRQLSDAVKEYKESKP